MTLKTNIPPPPRFDWRVHLVLAFVQVTFGAFHVVGKGVLASVPPLALAGARAAFATPLLLGLAWHVERRRPAVRDLPLLAALGMLGVFANQVFYILGLERASATVAGILMPSIPVFTVALAVMLGVERPSVRRAVGVLVAVGGALVVLDPTSLTAEPGATVGAGLILLNCLAFAVYLVLQRPLLERLPPLTMVAWAFVFGSAATLLVSARSLLAVDPAQIPLSVWIGLAYIVLVPTAVNYALNAWAVRRSSPGLVAAYTTVQPVAAALLAALFLGERVGVAELVGLVLIVLGLMTIARRTGPAPRTIERGSLS